MFYYIFKYKKKVFRTLHEYLSIIKKVTNYYLQFLRSDNEQIINDLTSNQTKTIKTDVVNTIQISYNGIICY